MAGKIIADQIEGTTTTETVSGVVVTIPNAIDTKYVVNGSAKAWIDHTQVTTSSIRDSLNISSLTDAGPGLTYPIAFINNMSSSSYASVMYTSATANNNYNNFDNHYTGGLGNKITSSFGHSSFGSAGFIDSLRNNDVIFGDLA